MTYTFSDWSGDENGKEGPEGIIEAVLLFGGLFFNVRYDWLHPEEYTIETDSGDIPERTTLYDQHFLSLANAVKQAQTALDKRLWDHWEKPGQVDSGDWKYA